MPGHTRTSATCFNANIAESQAYDWLRSFALSSSKSSVASRRLRGIVIASLDRTRGLEFANRTYAEKVHAHCVLFGMSLAVDKFPAIAAKMSFSFVSV